VSRPANLTFQPMSWVSMVRRALRSRGARGIAASAAGAIGLACAVGASPAGAHTTQFYGQTLFTHAPNAISIRFPPIQYDAQTSAAAFVVNPGKHKLNTGRKPFYVGVFVDGIGDNGQGADGDGGGGFYVEFVPPRGVSIVKHNHRYRPYWDSIPVHHGRGGKPVRQPTVPLFVKGADRGGTDVALPAVRSDGHSHLFSYETGVNRVEIFVPVRTTRKLTGIVKPGCAAINTVSPTLLGAQPLDLGSWGALDSDDFPTPCLPTQVGNDLQVAVYIADEGAPRELVPWVDMITSGPRRKH
jgi:hypothetical protein